MLKKAETAKDSSKEFIKNGLNINRHFSIKDVHPFDELDWEKRDANISDDKGNIIFKQEGVEVPANWSMLATNIVASKYFFGQLNTPEREFSVKQLVHRVARTIANWGKVDGYFKTAQEAEIFYRELTYLCVNQYGAFNSPVWFNCGLFQEYGAGQKSGTGNYYFDAEKETVVQAVTQYEYPQCSACFIQSVDDTMESILELACSEAMLFKFGSGTGTDLSTIRSSRETLNGGGTPSGPLSFLKVYDAVASAIKSGGKTRRAAKMNTLKCWHPDIKEFIEAKTLEEKKAWTLMNGGYSGAFNGEAYSSIFFQNENLSVRLTDDFMEAVLNDGDWQTHFVTDPNQSGPTYKARDILKWIAEGTWICGDPGVQYEDTIQHWHTCKHSAPINSSNPCSEYMFLNDTACNLASLNLMKFIGENGSFDVDRFKAAVDIFITAQDILVDRASYPTQDIALNSHRYRTLGLGYANLGALLMSFGHPYDSDKGRNIAAAITAIMHLQAFTHSARLAQAKGAFEEYENNKTSMLEVMQYHRNAVHKIDASSCPPELLKAASICGDEALLEGQKSGYRNAQVSVLAPTGTIGFMMDCDTTGVEPDIALVKYKSLAGGGMLKLVNQTVSMALSRLGYTEKEMKTILEFIEQNDTIENAPGLRKTDLPVFDCAFKPRKGKRFIPYIAHLKMMAAVQPFLSGAISKTVNMPEDASVEEIMQTYITGWEMGLKAVAIYRDGCKRSQPLSTSKTENYSNNKPAPEIPSKSEPVRKRLPPTRQSLTHRFEISGHEGYLNVGLYPDGTPGELFITMAKEGSTIGGLMDSFGTAISIALQYGVPLETLVHKFAHSRFEPSGFTNNPDIRIAKSLTDYIFRWLGMTFLKENITSEEATENSPPLEKEDSKIIAGRVDDQFGHFMEDAPACDQCGSITVRNGTCYRCYNCGNSMGCS